MLYAPLTNVLLEVLRALLADIVAVLLVVLEGFVLAVRACDAGAMVGGWECGGRLGCKATELDAGGLLAELRAPLCEIKVLALMSMARIECGLQSHRAP
eukprot:1161740-Pelagomonas_calceolata.AAC.14